MQARQLQQILNRHFQPELEVLGFFRLAPEIHVSGAYRLPPALAAAAADQARALQAGSRPDETHLILQAAPDLRTARPRLHAQTISYAEICALRQAGGRPALLSSGALIDCPQSASLLLQRRAATLATHPGHLHIVGGACQPLLDRSGGRCRLELGLLREVEEETGIRPELPMPLRYALLHEKSTGFVQFALPGLQFSPAQMQNARGNWEGSLFQAGYDDLPRLLREPAWVPSGKAQMLIWLGLGLGLGPGPEPAADRRRFAGMTAAELFAAILHADAMSARP